MQDSTCYHPLSNTQKHDNKEKENSNMKRKGRKRVATRAKESGREGGGSLSVTPTSTAHEAKSLSHCPTPASPNGVRPWHILKPNLILTLLLLQPNLQTQSCQPSTYAALPAPGLILFAHKILFSSMQHFFSNNIKLWIFYIYVVIP